MWIFIKILLAYLCIDVLKVTMIADPFFLGVADHPGPEYLPNLLKHPLVLGSYRTLITFDGYTWQFTTYTILCSS